MPDTISAGDIATLFNLNTRLREQEQLKEDQAIRYEGAQEYDALLKSGLSPEDAIRKTAHKMFYNDPGAFSGALRLAPTKEAEEPELRQLGKSLYRVRRSGGLPEEIVKAPPEAKPKPMFRVDGQGNVIQIDPESGLARRLAIGGAEARAPSMTDAASLAIEGKLMDLRKEAMELEPDSPEMQANTAQRLRLEERLGIKQPLGPPAPVSTPSMMSANLFGQGNPLVRFGQSLGRRMGFGVPAAPAAATNAPAPAMPTRGQIQVELASRIAAEHPDWSKADVISEVKKRTR
jgi:hypothetical protein